MNTRSIKSFSLAVLGASALLVVGCSVQGNPVASQTPVTTTQQPEAEQLSPAQKMLKNTFNVTGVSDEYLRATCDGIQVVAEDNYISELDLKALGIVIGESSSKYDWPSDKDEILAIIAVSSHFYCPQFVSMLGN